jgi:hypothetical protein
MSLFCGMSVSGGISTTPNFLAGKRIEDALGIMRQSQDTPPSSGQKSATQTPVLLPGYRQLLIHQAFPLSSSHALARAHVSITYGLPLREIVIVERARHVPVPETLCCSWCMTLIRGEGFVHTPQSTQDGSTKRERKALERTVLCVEPSALC